MGLFIGAVFVVLALLLGEHLMGVIYLLPMSALGILLIFAGVHPLDPRDHSIL